MKRMLLLCVIFLLLFLIPATAQETLTQSIVKNRDFFARLNGYDDCLLSDMEVLENGDSIGIILLSAGGFEQHFVFDVQTMIPIYANARILSKNDREFLIETSIKMTEVKKLVKAARSRAAELRKIWQLHEGKPGNIIPLNPPAQKAKSESQDYLSKIRQEVAKSDIVAAMNTEEVLNQFRADVRFSMTEFNNGYMRI